MSEAGFRQELERAKVRGDNHAQADLLTRLGSLLAAEGRQEEALDKYQQAYAIQKEQGDDRRRLDLICRVCDLLVELELFNEAEQGLAAGLDLARRINEVGPRARLLDISARLHLDQDRPGKAVTNINEAIDICQTYRDRPGELRMTELLAQALIKAARLADATIQFEKAIILCGQAKRPDRQASLMVELAQVRKNMGLLDQALESMKKAENLCLEHGQTGWASDLAKQYRDWLAEGR